ncbi:MAG: hypothetical protein RMN51_11665 [Verrucomicrobiota bacterium]|nr:hypothetical protein [Limisphaera sp.]MDW8382747.1 hypothetical protein [Verrucomicrobiota bacterium]
MKPIFPGSTTSNLVGAMASLYFTFGSTVAPRLHKRDVTKVVALHLLSIVRATAEPNGCAWTNLYFH